ncbi:MAG: endonuclease/exonuclease/phosphatase family protein [Aureliella sp.]
MKHLKFESTILVAMSILLGSAGSKAVAGEPIRLRVLSYNIHHGEGVDRKIDLKRIADVVTSVKADIVAMQEVDQNARRSGGVDQPAELARLTKMNVAFGPNIDLQGGKYGNAVLSRFPIVRSKNHLLPSYDGGEQRGVFEAEIDLPDSGRNLILLATHLDARRDHGERLESAKVINEFASNYPDRRLLLAGDLNATPSSGTLLRFFKTWTSANTKPLATIPVARPTKQIDYVLYRPSDCWQVIEANVLPEAVASDHRAILAVLQLQDRK